MTPEPIDSHDDLIRRRQRARSIVMAVLLGGFALLVFFIAMVKIKEGHG